MGRGGGASGKPAQEELIASCVQGTSKHAGPAVTSECFKSIYFSSSCEINKSSSLQTRKNHLQRQAQKLAAADAAGDRTKLPPNP